MTDLIERLRSRRMLASAGPITGEGCTHAQPMWLTHEPDTDCAEAADEIERLQAELAEWEKLRDPATLHTNLVRGFPAALSRESLLHLAGADQLLDALAEADRLLDHCDEPTAWRERWAHLFEREPHAQQGEAHD